MLNGQFDIDHQLVFVEASHAVGKRDWLFRFTDADQTIGQEVAPGDFTGTFGLVCAPEPELNEAPGDKPSRSLAAAAALALCAVALAATKTYEGAVKGDPEAGVEIELSKVDGRLVVSRFTATNFIITCKEPYDARLGSAELTGMAPVDDETGKFKLAGEQGGKSLSMRGRLLEKGRAKGRFSFAGLTTLDGEEVECASGRLDWTAKKSAAPDARPGLTQRPAAGDRIAASTPWRRSSSPLGSVIRTTPSRSRRSRGSYTVSVAGRPSAS